MRLANAFRLGLREHRKVGAVDFPVTGREEIMLEVIEKHVQAAVERVKREILHGDSE